MRDKNQLGFTGILLAAGSGSRFDPAGGRNKLLQPWLDGSVASVAAGNLKAATGRVIAVVRPGAQALTAQLQPLVTEVLECPSAGHGMAASIVSGLRASIDAPGWVIALADMPRVSPDTIRKLVAAIEDGADIAVPVHAGRRGNPVAFGRRYLPELLALEGDRGARALLQALPVAQVTVDDPGIHLDIDTPDDLEKMAKRD
jgi:molybdenum cofactor cytidylyltransferase